MVHCYKHVFESMEVVRRLVGGSSDSSFQLNEHQCQILAKELVETTTFLQNRSVACSKFGEGVGSISLRHLCSTFKRAKVLVEKCRCKDLESWLVSAMMLVEIQEEFVAIILDIHLWRMFLDFATTCERGLSQDKKIEEMKIMDDEYHQMFKDLRRERHALQQAAREDKKAIILRTSRIANLHGSTNGLDYLRAIYLQSWLTSSKSSKDVDLKKCEYLHLLGQGGCGTVMKVKWLGVECALKMLGGQDEKEATALKGLFHPNIIRLFHYWEDRPENPQSRLLMEFMPQDLDAYMVNLSSSKMQMGRDSMPFSLPVAIDIMYQIAQAMRYVHEKHLTHRDLKPANILVKERLQEVSTCIDGVRYLDIKLADFGLVKSYTNTSTFHAHSKNKGTGMYRAPEMFGKDMTQKRYYLSMADVWSFGITCMEILSGQKAYVEHGDKSPSDIQNLICKNGLRPTLPKHCPPYLAFCIKSCLELLPFRRPTFASLCKLLRHAKLLSLGVAKLDDSKFFFAFTTRSDQVQSMDLSPSSSRTRVSAFFQSSLKFMGIGPRQTPNVVEATTMHEVRFSPTPLSIEGSLEVNKGIGAGIASPRSLSDGEYHYSTIPLVADILYKEYKERVVSTPMASKESPLRIVHKDAAQSSATLVNPTQMVKSLLDLEKTVKLTKAKGVKSLHNLEKPVKLNQGSLDIAMSPPEIAPLADSIERGELLPDPEELAELTRASLNNAISPTDTLQAIHPQWILDRKMLKTKVMNPSWNPSKNRNNASQEAHSYQHRAPPVGSYQEDDTGPSPTNLLMAVMGVKSAVNHFAEVLITDINKHPMELEPLKQTILQEVRVDVDRADHWKFLVQAFTCKRLFDGFKAPNGYFDIEYFENDQRTMTKPISFADFSKFKDKALTISMLLESDSPDLSFLGMFCFKKFKSIIRELGSDQPLPIYQEEWDTIERERHPKSVFYQSFLKVAVSVWLVHRLVHSFEENVEMLIYENGARFQRQTMESVVPGSYEEEDEEADVNTEVGFSVIPGFQVSRSVVKCEVYLRSRSRHTGMEITGRTPTEKTPVKTPSQKTSKTWSAKSFVKPHTIEPPVRDSQSSRSLQPPESFRRSSHYYPPPRDEDSAKIYRDARRDSTSAGNQGSINGSGRKNKGGQDNLSETYPGSYDTSVNKMPAPHTRSSNARGASYAPRDTATSARRRQQNLRRNSTSV